LGVVRQVAVSALAAGFTNVFLMGEHGGGEAELKFAAESLDAEWRSKGAHVSFVGDLYAKSRERIDAYLVAHHIPTGAHAGGSDTSQVMFLDTDHKWIRQAKLAYASQEARTAAGIDGDPSQATAEMGRQFIEFKVESAVEEIQNILKARR